jgi:hypothetical protein
MPFSMFGYSGCVTRSSLPSEDQHISLFIAKHPLPDARLRASGCMQ